LDTAKISLFSVNRDDSKDVFNSVINPQQSPAPSGVPPITGGFQNPASSSSFFAHSGSTKELEMPFGSGPPMTSSSVNVGPESEPSYFIPSSFPEPGYTPTGFNANAGQQPQIPELYSGPPLEAELPKIPQRGKFINF
jgi:hypothetical protein